MVWQCSYVSSDISNALAKKELPMHADVEEKNRMDKILHQCWKWMIFTITAFQWMIRCATDRRNFRYALSCNPLATRYTDTLKQQRPRGSLRNFQELVWVDIVNPTKWRRLVCNSPLLRPRWGWHVNCLEYHVTQVSYHETSIFITNVMEFSIRNRACLCGPIFMHALVLDAVEWYRIVIIWGLPSG